MVNKKFWSTTFTLSGTMIGAGILGLPYIFAKAGFLIGLYWMIVLGAVIIWVNLSLGEVTLRTKERHQLPGYAGKYLGSWAEKLMLAGLLFGIYSSLLAYLVGEGQSFSKLLPGDINPIILGLAFWLTMTILLRDGLKNLKKVEMYGVSAIIILVIGLFIFFLPEIQVDNLTNTNPENFAIPIGVIMFSLLGFSSIPELRNEIRGQEKKFRKAIILGTLIPAALYLMFTSIFVGVLGENVAEVATLSFGGPIMTILGIFTMLTSYFVLSFSTKDIFKYDLKTKKTTTFFFSSIFPLFLYLIVSFFDLLNFTTILGIGGLISGGITGILILLINYKSKETTRAKGTKPEIKVPTTWPLIILISIIFISGTFLQFMN